MRAIPISGAGGVRGAAAAFGGRKLALSAVVLLISAFVGYQAYQRFAPKAAVAPVLQTAVVGQRTILELVTLPGTIAAGRQASLTFQAASNGTSVSGIVKSISVTTGDAVKAGQEVARLDTTSLDLAVQASQISLQSANTRMQQLIAAVLPSQVASAQQSVLSASGGVQNAQNTFTNAQSALDAIQGRTDSANQATASQNALASMQAQTTSAQADVDAALSRMEAAGSFTAAVRSALADLRAGVTGRCNTVGNRDQCAALAASATDLGSLIAAINSGTPAIPFDLTARLTAFDGSLEGGDAAGVRVATFRLLQATAATPGLNAQVNSLLASLSGAAGVPSADTLANAIRARDAAASGLEAARASLAAAQASRDQLLGGPLPTDIALQQQSLAQANINLLVARNNQQGAILLAPFDGLIGAITMNVGAQSGSGSIQLLDPLSMQLQASAQESDIAKLQVGQTVSLSFDAYSGATVSGKVSSVSPIAVVSQGVAAYPIVITVQQGAQASSQPGAGQPGGAQGGAGQRQQGAAAQNVVLRSGMTGTANVQVTSHNNVIAVPAKALKRQGSSFVAQVLVDGKQQATVVRTGATDGTYTEVTSGLNVGDTIVIPGAVAATGAAATAAAGTGAGGLGGPGGGFGGGGFPGGGGGIAPGKAGGN